MLDYKSLHKFPNIHYHVDVTWSHLKDWVSKECNPDAGFSALELKPDFQRGHVWTEAQQVAYVEYALRGGESGMQVHMNHPGWMDSWKGDFVLVDGLQRITAALKFEANELKVFGHLKSQIKNLPWSELRFGINISKLQTRAEVLQWYLDFNVGGTPHAAEEIERVRELLRKEEK